MKYDERMLQIRTSIAATQRADEDRRRDEEKNRPSRLRNIVLGGGPHLLWKIPVLIATVTFFVLYPKALFREANRYIHIPNFIVDLVPGLDSGGSMPGPLGLAVMGFAGLGLIVAGLGAYVWVRRAQNPAPRW